MKASITDYNKNKDNALEFLLESIIKSNSDITRIYVTRIDGMPVAAAVGKGNNHPDKDLIMVHLLY
ncbi:MAG: hypothetical protein ACTSP4_06595 [Candidatus Hodarchaeales archaeon]